MSCSDTSASASHVLASVFRAMSPTEKLAAVEQMSNETRELARCGIAARHPEHSVAEVEQALFRLLLGDELANRAWPAFAHSRAEFARRIEVEVLGCRVTIATAEDVLLAKLEWFAKGGSSRQLDDAAGIVRVQGDRLDVAYLRRWAAELDVAALLDEVLRADG